MESRKSGNKGGGFRFIHVPLRVAIASRRRAALSGYPALFCRFCFPEAVNKPRTAPLPGRYVTAGGRFMAPHDAVPVDIFAARELLKDGDDAERGGRWCNRTLFELPPPEQVRAGIPFRRCPENAGGSEPVTVQRGRVSDFFAPRHHPPTPHDSAAPASGRTHFPAHCHTGCHAGRWERPWMHPGAAEFLWSGGYRTPGIERLPWSYRHKPIGWSPNRQRIQTHSCARAVICPSTRHAYLYSVCCPAFPYLFFI